MSSSMNAGSLPGARGIGLSYQLVGTTGHTFQTSLPFYVAEIRFWDADDTSAATVQITTENQDWGNGASWPLWMLQHRAASYGVGAAKGLVVLRLENAIRWNPGSDIIIVPSMEMSVGIFGYPDNEWAKGA